MTTQNLEDVVFTPMMTELLENSAIHDTKGLLSELSKYWETHCEQNKSSKLSSTFMRHESIGSIITIGILNPKLVLSFLAERYKDYSSEKKPKACYQHMPFLVEAIVNDRGKFSVRNFERDGQLSSLDAHSQTIKWIEENYRR